MRCFLYFFLSLFIITSCQHSPEKTSRSKKPNIIILFADDLGYGDLSSYGHPTIHTPHLDSLAADGLRFTSYMGAPWCVPSRVELLTGKYMPRVNLGGGTGAGGTGGLPAGELTLAEGLKEVGYATGMAGKWHLGYNETKYLPTNQGFDSWLGLPYSNDYMPPFVQTDEPMVMYRDTTVTEYPVNQDSLTVKYTDEIKRYISGQPKDTPFFFYLAYNMPHLPIHTTEEFRGSSNAGLYGDVIQTIDWSVGEIRKTLREQGMDNNTIIFFTSDNGPWLNLPDRMLQGQNKPWHQGTTGPLRGAKHTTFEGGSRVPAIISWPGHISEGQVSDALVANPDIYQTMLAVGGSAAPDSIDGHNLLPLLTNQAEASPRKAYPYFYHGTLMALRVDAWKLKWNDSAYELYNLQEDVSERYDQSKEHPEIKERLFQQMKDLARETGTKLPG